jgi:hypothetical protein
LGVISVTDAASVVVENCHLQSADGPHRTTACLSVHGAQHAVVRGNRFEVGVQQGGVLLANVQNLQVESNLITGSSRSIGKMVGLLNDPQFLAAVRTRLVAHLFVGSLPPPGVIINVSDIIVGGQEVRFLAPVTHIVPWRNLLEQHQLPGNPAVATIENHVLGLANRILLENIVPSFAGIRNTILGNSTGSAQGITVGGTIGESIVIRNNRVSEFMQGIHVGLSAPSPNISLADRVVIHDNQIGVTLGMGATRGRHGVFVGNVRSLSIRGNRVTLARPSGTQNMQVDGIRVFGRLGRMAIIRENHLTGFNIGVRFELRGALPLTPMWMINDNLAEGSNPAVRAPDAANKSNNFA